MLSIIIHDLDNAERRPWVREAAERIPGLVVLPAIKREKGMEGCFLSHQMAVNIAESLSQPRVLVLEDDVLLTDDFDYHAFNLAARAYVSFGKYDILLGGVASVGIFLPWPTEHLAGVDAFSSTHCIVYRSSCYDAILRANPAAQHIDGFLSERKELRKLVTVPFVATQRPCYSMIRKCATDYADRFALNEKLLVTWAQQNRSQVQF